MANNSFERTGGEPAVYRSSVEAERFFCRQCGTQLALRDEPEAVRPSYDMSTTSRIGWLDLADGLPS